MRCSMLVCTWPAPHQFFWLTLRLMIMSRVSNRRFQPVYVPEPSVDETTQILMGLRERYEAHHKLRYTDEALEAASKYAHQYISDRCALEVTPAFPFTPASASPEIPCSRLVANMPNTATSTSPTGARNNMPSLSILLCLSLPVACLPPSTPISTSPTGSRSSHTCSHVWCLYLQPALMCCLLLRTATSTSAASGLSMLECPAISTRLFMLWAHYRSFGGRRRADQRHTISEVLLPSAICQPCTSGPSQDTDRTLLISHARMHAAGSCPTRPST